MSDYKLPDGSQVTVPDDIDKYLAQETVDWFLGEIQRERERIEALERRVEKLTHTDGLVIIPIPRKSTLAMRLAVSALRIPVEAKKHADTIFEAMITAATTGGEHATHTD